MYRPKPINIPGDDGLHVLRMFLKHIPKVFLAYIQIFQY